MTHRAPTQAPAVVAHPWRATLRTVIVAGLGLLPLLPEIARAADIDTVPAVAATLTIIAAVQRVISTPEVERWLRDTTHALSSVPAGEPQADALDDLGRHHRKDTDEY